MNKYRDTSLDFIRGIGIIIVVLAHAMQINLPQNDYNNFWMYIRIFQMPLLFFISGYTSGFSYPSDKPIIYIKSKIFRLVIPYIVWAEIFMVIYNIYGDGRHERFSMISMLICLKTSPF